MKYLKTTFDFECVDIISNWCDSHIATNSAHIFIVEALLSTFKDIVHILLVQNITEDQLHKIIIELEEIGFKVIHISMTTVQLIEKLYHYSLHI